MVPTDVCVLHVAGEVAAHTFDGTVEALAQLGLHQVLVPLKDATIGRAVQSLEVRALQWPVALLARLRTLEDELAALAAEKSFYAVHLHGSAACLLGSRALRSSTLASRAWSPLSRLGPAFMHIKGVITREDMAIVADKLSDIEMDYNLDAFQREQKFSAVQPLFEPGYLFDDYQVGGWLYRLKATVVGINESKWITVTPFSANQPDNGGLERAYNEFLSRIGKP